MADKYDPNSTFTCETCNKEIPYYIDGQFQPSLGMNLGWGKMEWCKKCQPPTKTAEEIIKDFDLFLNPIKESPERVDK